jgi:hypothetical protein
MDWYTLLSIWKYPKAGELAPVLEDIGIEPKYSYPWELAKDLASLIDRQRGMIYVKGEWRPLAWYDPIIDFFKWVGEQIYNFLKPYIGSVVLIVIGGLITWLASGYYKAVGAIPIIAGVYLLIMKLREQGVF